MPDDIVDDCPDEDVKQWFNKAIFRYEGGLRKDITRGVNTDYG
jgi:hypothetical protein